MIDFLGKRLQKSLAKINKKTIISQEDIQVAIREIKFALLEADVNLKIVKNFIKNVNDKIVGIELNTNLNASQYFIKVVRNELEVLLGGKTKEIKLTKKPTIIMMVGLQGSGKTTTSAKIAKYFTKHKQIKKPLLIAADVYRPAAMKQLEVLAQKINSDIYANFELKNPVKIIQLAMKQAIKNENDFIVIDTAGRLSIDEKLMQELKEIKKNFHPHEIIFVVDAMSGQDVINVAQIFHDNLNLTGAIITKLDSEARGGAAFSVASTLKLPIHFAGTGEKTEDLELFHPDRMADRILGMGDVLSLIEKVEENIDAKSAQKMINRIGSGHFDLNDLMSQLEQMKKMGKLSKLVSLIPGAKKIPKEKIDSAVKKLELFTILISSMTREERKYPRLLKQPKRKIRIIAGSGRTQQEYNLLVSEFDRMKKQMKAMSKAISSGQFNPSMFGGLG